MKIFKKEKIDNIRKISILGLKFEYKKGKESTPVNSEEKAGYNLEIYDEEFYKGQASKSYQSAKEILNLISKIIPNINSAVDVGCGVGTWLKVWTEINPKVDIKGFDCNNLSENLLYIPRNKIDIKDLENLKFENINKKFDICHSLECAEHLYEKDAVSHIKLLTQLSDIVLFSAAAPKQTGTNHYNEREPEYWSKIFNSFGYNCYDPIRSKIWNNENISWWYRQNIMLFVNSREISNLQINLNLIGESVTPNLYYHPELLNMHVR